MHISRYFGNGKKSKKGSNFGKTNNRAEANFKKIKMSVK